MRDILERWNGTYTRIRDSWCDSLYARVRKVLAYGEQYIVIEIVDPDIESLYEWFAGSEDDAWADFYAVFGYGARF